MVTRRVHTRSVPVLAVSCACAWHPDVSLLPLPSPPAHSSQSGSVHLTQVTAPLREGLPTRMAPLAQLLQEPSSRQLAQTSGQSCIGRLRPGAI